MISESTIIPTGIQVVDSDDNILNEFLTLDIVKEGSARILARWNINEISYENDNGITYTKYQYDEKVIWWALPLTYIVNENVITLDASNRASVETYITSNCYDIIGYIKQSEVSW